MTSGSGRLWGGAGDRPSDSVVVQLGDAALIDVLLGTANRARRDGGRGSLAELMLMRLGGVRGLAEAGAAELLAIPGIGPARAGRILTAIELGRRVATRQWCPGVPFTSARQVFHHYQPLLRHQKSESFIAVLLDARHRRIGDVEVSRGSLVASIVHPREVYRPAIRAAAAAVICVHNHPSGDPGLSEEDILITRRLHRAGATIGIDLLDHVVVADGGYTSFVDRGIPPFGRPRLGGGPLGGSD